jgi:hypothetical protein
VTTNTGRSPSLYPVVHLGNITYWPLSYDDNRYSFAVVVTDSDDTTPLNTFEAPGARYIDYIVVNQSDKTVLFYGQGNDAAVIAWDVLSAAATATNNFASGNSSNSSPDPSTPSSPNTGAIAGGAVGGVVGLILVASLLWWLLRYCKERSEAQGNLDQATPPGMRSDAGGPYGWKNRVEHWLATH